MAAPLHKTIKDLNGKWKLNSHSAEEALVLQGVSYFVRRGIHYANITLDINQYEAPSNAPDLTDVAADGTKTCVHIDIQQSFSNIPSAVEKRRLDDQPNEHSDWVFGALCGRSKWVTLDEVDDPFLRSDWDTAQQSAAKEDKPVFMHGDIVSRTNSWTVRQLWGFRSVQGERRYVRNVVEKEGQRVDCRLV